MTESEERCFQKSLEIVKKLSRMKLDYDKVVRGDFSLPSLTRAWQPPIEDPLPLPLPRVKPA